MPVPPYATLQVSVDAGAPQTGAVDCPKGGQVIQLSAASTAGWQSARWEIFAPSGYATPAGWSLDALTGAIYYVGTTPPPFTLALCDVLFGKYMLRLIINGATVDRLAASFNEDLVDTKTAIRVRSTSGLNGLGALEGDQFDAVRAWSGQLHADLVALNATSAVQTPDATPVLARRFPIADGAVRLIRGLVKVQSATGAVYGEYEIKAAYKRVSGTLAQLYAPSITTVVESDAGLTVAASLNGNTDVDFTVTGLAGTPLVWTFSEMTV